MKLSLVLANLRRQQKKIFVINLQYVFTLSKQMSRTVANKKIKSWGKTTSVVKDLSSVEDSSVDQLCVLHFHNCFFLMECKNIYQFLCRFYRCRTWTPANSNHFSFLMGIRVSGVLFSHLPFLWLYIYQSPLQS